MPTLPPIPTVSLPRVPGLPDPLRRVHVPRDLRAITTVGAAEVPAADGDMAQAVSTLESRGRAVPIRLRRVYGAQAAAFAATLPVGFVPWEHTLITPDMREWL